MKDIASRFTENPILKPNSLKPTNPDLQVVCVLNPGVFSFLNKTWLLVRVAENVSPKEGSIFLPALKASGQIDTIEVRLDDPDLIATDARVVTYRGLVYLTTISHLRLLQSDDGINFREAESYPPLIGNGELEGFGIEDARVTKVEGCYYITYTAVSENGVCVGLRTTKDWKNFEHLGIIMPPHNKDCAIFEEKINGKYFALHRPSSVEIGGNFIWLASSYDGIHWGDHKCILKTRTGFWDDARIGAGASPIKTPAGWLAIYHGANQQNRYCLGALLLDLEDPSVVMGRTAEPIMSPSASYELTGFFGQVVFTNGHLVNGDELTIYYGAADEFVCGAKFSINEILKLITLE